MSEPIVVTREKLATAMTVWLRVMPKRIWRELEKHNLLALQKRQGNRPDVERAVAEHLAEQFSVAKWEVNHAEPGGLGSPPSWEHNPAD
jgi:hypothetical protein